MLRPIAAALCAVGLAGATAASAHVSPRPEKLIVLVRAEGCEFARLKATLASAGRAMVRDSRTTRVVVDWPVDPVHNPDMMGNPSPIIAALEISATQAIMGELAGKVRRKLARACPSDIYLVHERRLLTTPRSWKLGKASPETKVLVTMARIPGISLAEFVGEWGGGHAELALAWRRARGGAGHYVQNIVVEAVGEGTPELDGIGEIEGPGTRTVSDDERKARMQTAAHARSFQDMDNSAMFVAREVILKD